MTNRAGKQIMWKMVPEFFSRINSGNNQKEPEHYSIATLDADDTN